MKTNCYACTHSGMEPDGDPRLICYHKDAGTFGKWAETIGTSTGASDVGGHCGPERPKFEQHPHRNADGSLKK
jgi:hypothetical protein